MEELSNNNNIATVARQEPCVEKNSRMMMVASPFTDTMEQKWNTIMVGGLGMMFIIIVFLGYRFLRTINQRLHSLEEILAKVIEKNNHLQHMIQASATTRYIPSPMETSPPMVVSVQSQSVPVPVPPKVPVPVSASSSVNLDREILEELQELQAPTPVPAHVSVPASVPINEISEGRIEDEDKNK